MVNAVKKVPVGAHYGWQDWLVQRVTAVIMVLFSVVIIGFFVLKGGTTFAEWKDLFRAPLFRILALLFFLSVYYHAWIGIKDVLMDYVKPTGMRLTIQVAVLLFLLGCSIWTVTIIWGN
jgi:succinate dehydrogenase / fumarate reductase, membrane anchor subunit